MKKILYGVAVFSTIFSIILFAAYISIPPDDFQEEYTAYKISDKDYEIMQSLENFTVPELPTFVIPTIQESAPNSVYGCYIGNSKTKIYHLPSCSYLPTVNNFTIQRKDLHIYTDFSPCKHCIS